MTHFTRTDQFITTPEKEEVLALYKTASTTPVIALTSADALSGNDFASRAWRLLHARLDGLAHQYGLPEIEGQYGLDFETGEILGP